MNQRVTLQRRATGVDALGQPASTWEDIATVWAQAEPLRGREFFAAGQTQQEAQVRFRIRWRADVVPAMRVLWRGEPHEIGAAINVDGARAVLELMASAGVKEDAR